MTPARRLATRAATEADLDAIAAIYSHESSTALATFDLEPPDRDYWLPKLRATPRRPPAGRGRRRRRRWSATPTPGPTDRPAYELTRGDLDLLDASVRGTAARPDALPGAAGRRWRSPGCTPRSRWWRCRTRPASGCTGVRLRAGRHDARGRLQVRPVDRRGVVPEDAVSHAVGWGRTVTRRDHQPHPHPHPHMRMSLAGALHVTTVTSATFACLARRKGPGGSRQDSSSRSSRLPTTARPRPSSATR